MRQTLQSKNLRVLFLALISGLLPDQFVQSGEIKGRVLIMQPTPSAPVIMSRAIIMKYAAKDNSAPADKDKNKNRVAIVYLNRVEKGTASSAVDGEKIMILDQAQQRFVPHVLPIVIGTTVRFLNSDDVYHNVFSYSRAKTFDLGRYATGKFRAVKFDRPGLVKVYCDIHPHMNAFILVLENPHFEVVDGDGNFELRDVPAGTYTLNAWYGRWPEQTMAVTISDGETVEVNFTFPE